MQGPTKQEPNPAVTSELRASLALPHRTQWWRRPNFKMLSGTFCSLQSSSGGDCSSSCPLGRRTSPERVPIVPPPTWELGQSPEPTLNPFRGDGVDGASTGCCSSAKLIPILQQTTAVGKGPGGAAASPRLFVSTRTMEAWNHGLVWIGKGSDLLPSPPAMLTSLWLWGKAKAPALT